MGPARWKLISLWLSQTARVTADNALRFFVCLDYAFHGDVAHKNSAWYLVNAIFTLPAVLFAPVNGAICNSLPRSRVLTWSAFYGLFVMAVFLFVPWPLQRENRDAPGLEWMVCWALISIGSAIYGPTRYAMLPAAAADTRWSLSRINGFIEMGTFTAILGGLVVIVGTSLQHRTTLVFETWIAAIALVFLLNGLAFVTALPVSFPSDVRRPEPAWQAVRDFFSDFRRIWAIKEARVCLIGLSGKRGMVIGMSGAMLAIMFGGAGPSLPQIAEIAAWVAGGVAVGSMAAGLQKHPRRVLGLVPFAATGFSIGLAFAATGDAPNLWFCALVGVMAGMINVPLASTYQAAVPADARGNAMAVRNMTDYLCVTFFGIGLFLLGYYADFDGPRQLWLVASIAGVATLAAWWIFRREVAEQLLEFPFWIMYRFRAVGPGLDQFPLQGPVIVVANHSCYMDPLLLGKVLPRSLIPMMTSYFFDHWFLRLTMIHLADAIRVEASGFRREIPELQTAIDTLDAGKCLVIFPEGRLRRTEEVPLRMFGQGVWHILKDRPKTPVVVCWIEGGWGSYFSYFNGLPTKNKKFDVRHPIGIAIGEPQLLDVEILADQRKTRLYLMEQCLDMRKYLGLEPLEIQCAEKDEELI